jgi:hypothetical protein
MHAASWVSCLLRWELGGIRIHSDFLRQLAPKTFILKNEDVPDNEET